ncbi:MAG TPA: hypothetical protein VJP07_08505 [Dehalococcoidia bacterium]|nr:hypothetical protein [Dehalococcoidia bacterium]
MLILDKHRAVERMLALAEGHPAANPEDGRDPLHGRAYRRVAVFERRASFDATLSRRAERGAGLLRPAGGAPSLY